jgi:endonuclease-3 related protein
MSTRSRFSAEAQKKTIPGNNLPLTAKSKNGTTSPLPQYFDALIRAYGPQHWWPGRTRFEVIAGAILTQNTNWPNVERALVQLRKEKLLNIAAILRVPSPKLARLIRSSGYFREKARKLKEFAGYVQTRHGGSLTRMFRSATAQLREELLQTHGIGPETADAILLYAGKHPVFVIDAYTRRVLARHGLASGRESYEELRALFERSLPRDAAVYNEYHALLVHTGKQHCRKARPECDGCALEPFLPRAAMKKA